MNGSCNVLSRCNSGNTTITYSGDKRPSSAAAGAPDRRNAYLAIMLFASNLPRRVWPCSFACQYAPLSTSRQVSQPPACYAVSMQTAWPMFRGSPSRCGVCAADHDLAGFMQQRIVERLPIQHVIGLFAKRDIRVRVGVNKEMPIRFVVWPAASLKEFPVCGRDAFKAAAASADGIRSAAPRNRRASDPIVVVLLRSPRSAYHDFVVAAKRNESAASLPGDQPIEDRAAVRAAVDIIPQHNKQFVGRERRVRFQGRQCRETTVDVTNGENSHIVRLLQKVSRLNDGDKRNPVMVIRSPRALDSRQGLVDCVADCLGKEAQDWSRRIDQSFIERLHCPGQIALPGTIDFFAGLQLPVKAEQVVSHMPEVIVDLARVVLVRGENGFDVSDIKSMVPHGIHETKLLAQIEKANVHPQGQRQILLLGGSVSSLR